MPQFDPDGGELGRAAVNLTTALELQIVIPHVASILNELAANDEKAYYRQKPYYYGFELFMTERDAAQLVIMTAKLPPRVEWYQSNGQNLFEIRSASGGVVSKYICYLITKG